MRKYVLLFGLCLPAQSFAETGMLHADEKDIYFGEAYYHAYQGEYVDAISRLDIGAGQIYGADKPGPDPLHFQFGYSRLSVGDFELSYRMPQRAESAIKAILINNTAPLVRNRALYRLARISLQQGKTENAQQATEQITGQVPDDIREDALFLHALIYMANNKFADAAKKLLPLQNSESYRGFAAYNLGVAYIKGGQEDQGLDQLGNAGQTSGVDDVTSSLRDKANLALGYRLLDAKPQDAKQYFERVRLNGPYSNKALLGSGWADIALGSFDKALTPWSALAKRNIADKSVQEGMLGVPYAYGKLNLPGKAAVLYGKALDEFGRELARLDASIRSVREGRLLPFLLQEYLRQDKNWIAKIGALPEKPETYYLPELMASEDFRESARNYLDLNELLIKLESWDEKISAYEELVTLRRKYFESVLPNIDKQFLALDSWLKLRLEQRQQLESKIKYRLVKPPSVNESLVAETNEHLLQLDDAIQNTRKIHAFYSSKRQFITQNYQGHEDMLRLTQFRKMVRDSKQHAGSLANRQGQILEALAIKELDQRRKSLLDYQSQAMFALADSYERASKKQPPPGAVK